MNKKIMKFNKKMNNFFKETILYAVIISFILNLLGVIFSHLDGFKLVSTIMFLFSLLFTGLPIFYKAIQSLISRIIGIELLVFIAVIGAITIGEYSEAGIVCFLFQFGYLLELHTLEKTRGAIKELVKNAPKVALRLVDGNEETIDVDEVEIDDILILHAGKVVPVDGIIESGEGYFIEASITGESKPVYKEKGDTIFAGSIVDNGDLTFVATKTSDDSTYQKIISLVEEASDNKSKLVKFIDKFAKYYTPLVILLAVSTLFIKYFITKEWDIDTSITVLVLACPGALVIGVPVASVAGIGKASKNHILLKGGDNISLFSKTDIFVFDKTGTLTKGNSKIVSSYYYGDNESEDIKIVYSMEKNSLHPLAKAILSNYEIEPLDINTDTIKGKGIKYNEYLIGSVRLMEEEGVNLDAYKDVINTLFENGSSIILVSKNKKIIFIYEIADEIKDEAKEMVSYLLSKNKRVVMLSGDNELVCKNVCNKLGIKEYYSELLPEEKMEKIKEFKEKNYVSFIGDGVNDSPSLTLADVGISMGNATDVAIETSDVILIKNDMMDLVKAYKIAKKTIRISVENVVLAILTVVLLLVGLFLDYIHMSIGMLIHETSILVVIFNAMRLLIEREK